MDKDEATNVIRINADDTPEEVERKMTEGTAGIRAVLDAYRRHLSKG